MSLVVQFSPIYGVTKCLSLLGLAKSSYCAMAKERPSLRRKYHHLKPTIERIIQQFPAYGYRRIQVELEEKHQIIINHKLLKKLLRVWGLSLRRRIKPKQESGIIKLLKLIGSDVNLIRLIAKPMLFETLATDMTEITYQGGKLYLAAILDLVGKRVIGWSASEHPDIQLVLMAYQNARAYLSEHKVDLSRSFIHQDQGSVYTSYEYVATLLKDGITLSYSRVGCPQDNPEVESFFGRWKAEYYPIVNQAQTQKEVKQLIDQTINEYNETRRHSSLNYQSPDNFIKQILTTNYSSLIPQGMVNG